MVTIRFGLRLTTDSRLPSLVGKRRAWRHRIVSRGCCARWVTETICSGAASTSNSSSVHRLSEATRTAALAPISKADAGIQAPPFGAVAEHVLVALVEGVGG